MFTRNHLLLKLDVKWAIGLRMRVKINKYLLFWFIIFLLLLMCLLITITISWSDKLSNEDSKCFQAEKAIYIHRLLKIHNFSLKLVLRRKEAWIMMMPSDYILQPNVLLLSTLKWYTRVQKTFSWWKFADRSKIYS